MVMGTAGTGGDRNLVVRQIGLLASLTKRDAAEVWGDLYRDFGYRHNIAFNRIAHNEDLKVIDVIDREGLLGDFSDFVEKALKAKTSALPVETKKAPVQGSLLEGEQ